MHRPPCLSLVRLALTLPASALFAAPSLQAQATSASAPAPTAAATLPAPAKQKYNRGPWENEIGYTQAVRVGNLLYVSGTTGHGEMAGAIKQAYDGLAQTLAAYGLDFRHVIKENAYTTDIEALKTNKAVRNAYYAGDYPAATWVQITRLFTPDTVLEVEVIAAFPEEKPKS